MKQIDCQTRVLATLLLAFTFVSAYSLAEQPSNLDRVNAALEGKVARIEFTDGRVLRRAKKVNVGQTITSWRARGEDHRSPTSAIRRITTKKRFAVLRGIGIGMGAAAWFDPLDFLLYGGGGILVDPIAGAMDLEDVVLVGGLVGGLVAGLRDGEVVFYSPYGLPALEADQQIGQ